MKANSNIAVLRALVKQGSGLDIVSGGELERAKRAGCPGEKIVFAGVPFKGERRISAMIAVTVDASMKQCICNAWPGFKANPWAVATLFDAYFGFLTFFVWVAFKESSMARRAVWFVLIMCLGNMAMAAYVLIQLFRLKPEDRVESVLWSRAQ